MTVETLASRARFLGDGVTPQFDLALPYIDDADIRLVMKVGSSESVLALGANYSLTRIGSGGRVNLGAPLAVGAVLAAVRDPAPIQSITLQSNDKYFLEAIERAFDRQAMILQRHADLHTRSMVLAETDLDGAGAFQARGNRLTGLAPGVNASDAATVAQLVSAVGGDFIISPETIGEIVTSVIGDSGFLAMFTPINSELGSLADLIANLTLTVNADLNTLGGRVTTVEGSISIIESLAEQYESIQDLIDQLNALNEDPEGLTTLIQAEQTARIDGDTAIAQTIAKLGALSGDSLSFILDLSTVKVGPSETLAQRLTAIAAADTTNQAAITSEASTRAAADTALATTISKLGALSGDNSAFILNLSTTRVAAGETLAQRLDGISSRFNSNEAAILAEQVARADADSALSASITTTQSAANGAVATVQAIQSTVNGVNARFSVKVDNNGYISGIGLISQPNNGAITSAFVVLADQFRVVHPGASAVAPFEVIGGVVYMRNIVVRNAQIENLAIGKLTAGTLNADMTMGTGRIIWSNGTYMKVAGVGFGSTNQFIEWYGPYFANLAGCTEANAISYLKTNGSAYFGGSLSAGVLRNSITTTDQSASATVTLGPFGTNGGSKSVVLSYSYTYGSVGTDLGAGATSATILLERSINGGANWTTVTTLNATGTYFTDTSNMFPVYGGAIGGSVTVTDPTSGVSPFMYRARLSGRTIPTGGSNQSIVQSITIVSTEG